MELFGGTGRKIFEEFKREIADPLGMGEFDVEDGIYNHESENSLHPGYHFRMTARDMARFGLLYLQGGEWGGRQLIPSDWINWSTVSYSQDILGTPGLGYGQLWYVTEADLAPFGPGFLHTGAGVHMLLVLPEENIVLVHRVDTDQPLTMTGDQMSQLIVMVLQARMN